MAFLPPQSKLRLCRVPWDATYSDVVYFENRQEQIVYFRDHVTGFSLSEDEYSYIRKDGILRINRHADFLHYINYCEYENTSHSNKKFYAFVKKVEYLSDSSCAVHLETDLFQTYFLDGVYNKSFVVREHVVNDLPGYNTVPENLELGDYVVNTERRANFDEYAIMVATSVTNITVNDNFLWKDYNKTVAEGNMLGGVYNGCAIFAYNPENGASVQALNNFLKKVTEAGAPEVISAIFMWPKSFLAAPPSSGGTKQTIAPSNINVSAPIRPGSINGYAPKNKKLLSFPYTFLYVHNNNGSSGIYPYEFFTTDSPQFEIYGTPQPGGIIKATPKNYKGIEMNYDESISLGDFPLCNWTYDAYLAWLSQSSTTAYLSTASSVLSTAVGVATANPIAIVGGIVGAGASLSSLRESAAQSPQSKGNVGGGSANIKRRTNDFFFQCKSIKNEYAKIIDEYFTKFGYKVNRLKKPEFKTRMYWNYLQVLDINVNIPLDAEEIDRFKKIFSDGVTLWHNWSTQGFFGNYRDNNPVRPS